MKSNTTLLKLCLLLTIICLPFLSRAHGYWLETQGSGKIGEPVKILMFYGEYAEAIREKGNKLDKMTELKVSVIDALGKQSAINMVQKETHWEGTFTPTTNGNYQILAINDTREVQDFTKHNLGITRPVQFMRTTYQVGKASATNAKNLQFLDVTANQENGKITLSAFKDKQALAKTKLTIINPQTWEKTKFTNENGQTTFTPTGKGLYLVELEWIDTNSGTFKGKDYQTIRYKSEMTFVID